MSIEELKKAQKKVVGTKQTIKSLEKHSEHVDKVYIAKDAEDHVIQPIQQLAQTKQVEIVFVNSMHELGQMCGIKVKAAVAAILGK